MVDTSRHEVTERGFTFFSTVRGSVSNASGPLSNSSIASHDKCIVCGTSDASKNKIMHQHKTLIAEQMVRCEHCSWSTVLDTAAIPPEAMHECIEPRNRIVHGSDGKVRIITKVSPYPGRRVRLVDDDDDD